MSPKSSIASYTPTYLPTVVCYAYLVTYVAIGPRYLDTLPSSIGPVYLCLLSMLYVTPLPVWLLLFLCI